MPELLLALFAILVLYAITAGARFGHLSVISLFVYAQATMAVGTIPSLDPTLAADHMHATVIVWSFCALVMVAVLYSFAGLRTVRRAYDPDVSFEYPGPGVAVLIVVSVAISALYYLSVGYLAFFESLEAVFNDTGEDLAALRLESYAGSRYFFPGYVNQFKNSLLPALVIVVIVSAHHFKRPGRLILAFLLIPPTLVFLLGTGQRGAFVISLALVAIFAYLASPGNARKYFSRILLVGVPLFFLTTVASGRANRDLQAAQGLGGQVGVLFEQLAFRLLGSNQTSSIVGFRYIYEQKIPFASEWAQSFVGLLPGQSGSDLSNRIFAVLYGSSRGTSPLSLWGAAYHNLGLIGTILFAAAIAVVLCAVAGKINRARQVNILQVVGMAGVTITIGTWIADGPVSILNKGIVVYAVLWAWGAARQRRIGREGRSRPGRLRPAITEVGQGRHGPVNSP